MPRDRLLQTLTFPWNRFITLFSVVGQESLDFICLFFRFLTHRFSSGFCHAVHVTFVSTYFNPISAETGVTIGGPCMKQPSISCPPQVQTIVMCFDLSKVNQTGDQDTPIERKRVYYNEINFFTSRAIIFPRRTVTKLDSKTFSTEPDAPYIPVHRPLL